MTASALLTVVGVTLVMEQAGLSASLGAFIAGVLLADSEYRHEISADIAPFEGLLLGLFFTAVGMSLNLGLVAAKPMLVLAVVAGLLAVKIVILYVLGRRAGLEPGPSRRFALAIAQGGEFAFVLFAAGVSATVLEPQVTELLSVAVTLSMAATPLLLLLDEIFTPKAVADARLRRAARGRWPRGDRRLRSRRPDRGTHPQRQAHPLHGTRRQSPSRSISCASSAPRSTTAMPAGPRSWRPPRPARRAPSCWPSTTSTFPSAPRRWCARTIRTCRSSRARATASTPTG